MKTHENISSIEHEQVINSSEFPDESGESDWRFNHQPEHHHHVHENHENSHGHDHEHHNQHSNGHFESDSRHKGERK